MIEKWIWQLENYPQFVYDEKLLYKKLLKLKEKQGYIKGITSQLDTEALKNYEVDSFVDEAVYTSEIEGEMLNRDSVRSSILKKLYLLKSKDLSTKETDGLSDIMLDVAKNYNEALSEERLLGWHNALFPTGYSGMLKINVARYRDEPISVVSGHEGKEVIKYEAVPVKQVVSDMNDFLYWIDDYEEDEIIKAGIAHLWFLIIHPFDDGNGRIARAINDLILSKASQQELKLYSISKAIHNKRKEYYEVLDKTTHVLMSKSLDITLWLSWYLDILKDALDQTDRIVQKIYFKTNFWDRFREEALNAREIKVLNKMLDVGVEAYEGGMTTKKYRAITKASEATSKRDIAHLVEIGCLKQAPKTKGRNVFYNII